MKIGIAADHAGQALKATLVEHLRETGHEVKQYGPAPDPDDDYPLIVRVLADAIARGEVERGIFTCGSGIGPAVAANKIRGIRAAVNFITGTVLLLLSKAHATVTISGPDISAHQAAQIARIVALSLDLSLAIGAIACFAIGAVDLWRAIARDGNRVPLTPGVVV